MRIPTKTLGCGFSLPVYGLGTWAFGGGRNQADTSNDAADIAAIRSAIDHGISHLDTAERYGGGHSEEQIGQAIKGVDRENLFLASKVQAFDQRYDDLLGACERSLRRLGTDYLDLYYLHRFPEPGIDPADTMRAVDRLLDEGLIHNVGVCNLTVKRFEALQNLTDNKIVCNQVEYSLRFREAEARGIIDYCQQRDILIVAWGPLGIGSVEPGGLLEQLASACGKTPHQVALNWLLSQQNVVTISKTGRAAHLEENLGAIGWQLADADVERLSRGFPDQQRVSARLPLDYAGSVAA